LLLLRVAPHCETYVGTDFSPAVLQSLQKRVKLAGVSDKVTLLQRESSDFDGLAPGSVDLVVINSVSQYLPGIEHLLLVIEGAVSVLAPGGRLFIGDVRNFDLLEAFHTSVELFRAPDAMTTDELRRRVSDRIAAESELAISPEFFDALPNYLPTIERVEVSLKRGRADNELTRFRYDATLRLQTPEPGDPASSIQVIDWATSGLDLGQVRSLLQKGEPSAICLNQVPNSRVQADVLAVELLDRPELETVAELQEMLRSGAGRGHSPEDFWILGAGLGYSVEVSWCNQNPGGHYDVLLWRQGSVRPRVPGAQHSASVGQPAWARYANQLSANSLSRSLVTELRHHLSQRLPDYMIPQAFVLLDALPLTPSGKIDRRSLPEPESGERVSQSYQPPRTPAERTIAEIWASVLKVDRVGIEDNFFELGGHSLLATQAMSRIRHAVGIDLPLRTIFEAPTVTALAAAITNQPPDGSAAAAERLLGDLDEISDEEAERLLAAEGQSEHR
jgi:SAM-dependent methyltransferase/acyl carrier protein